MTVIHFPHKHLKAIPFNDERIKGFATCIGALQTLNCFSDEVKAMCLGEWVDKALITAPEALMLRFYYGL